MNSRGTLVSASALSLSPGDVIVFGPRWQRRWGVIVQVKKDSNYIKLLLLSFGDKPGLQKTQFYPYEYVSML